MRVDGRMDQRFHFKGRKISRLHIVTTYFKAERATASVREMRSIKKKNLKFGLSTERWRYHDAQKDVNENPTGCQV